MEKKRKLLHYAMDAVMDSDYNNDIKLEVLKFLFEEERTIIFFETQNTVVNDEQI